MPFSWRTFLFGKGAEERPKRKKTGHTQSEEIAKVIKILIGGLVGLLIGIISIVFIIFGLPYTPLWYVSIACALMGVSFLSYKILYKEKAIKKIKTAAVIGSILGLFCSGPLVVVLPPSVVLWDRISINIIFTICGALTAILVAHVLEIINDQKPH